MPLELKLYTKDELWEMYDKEFHSESPTIQDNSSWVQNNINDNYDRLAVTKIDYPIATQMPCVTLYIKKGDFGKLAYFKLNGSV